MLQPRLEHLRAIRLPPAYFSALGDEMLREQKTLQDSMGAIGIWAREEGVCLPPTGKGELATDGHTVSLCSRP